MIKVNIIINEAAWKKKIRNPYKFIKNKIKKLSKIRSFEYKSQEFSILLTNNKEIKILNNKFRKKNKPTDVLSFPISNKYIKKGYIGDIAISFDFIKQRSKLKNFYYEFDKTWIHGYLHLVGYDHKSDNEHKKMQKK